MKRDQEVQEKLESLLEMLADDGAAPPGKVNPGHVEKMKSVSQRGDAASIAKSHKQGIDPQQMGQGD